MIKTILLVGVLFIAPFFVVKAENTNFSSDLFISEIAYSGSNLESNCQKSAEIERVGCGLDKWLEIANNSNQEIDLKNYKIRLNYRDITITENWLIPAKSVGILANKNKNLTSSLDTLPLNIYKIGFLQGISSKEKASLSVELVSPNNLLLDSIIMPVEFGSYKKTLDKINQKWNLSDSEYLPNNYGTPGKFNFANISNLVQKTDVLNVAPTTETIPEKPVPTIETVAKPISLPKLESIIQSTLYETKAVSESLKTVVKQEIKPGLKIQKAIALPKPALKPISKKIVQIAPKIEQASVIVVPKLISLKAPEIIKIKPNQLVKFYVVNNSLSIQKSTLAFLNTDSEQVLILSFLTVFSLLQKIITKNTKKCKPIFAHRFKTK